MFWEKYLKEDSRLIRPLDGYEYYITMTFLYVSDIFDKFDIEKFKNNCQEELPKINIFNLGIKRIDNYIFWIKIPFKFILEETKYDENEEIENFLKNEENLPKNMFRINDENEKGLERLIKFKICQLKNNKIKLTLFVQHSICDGRTIFNIFDLIRKIIQEKKLEKNECNLCDFGQKSNFNEKLDIKNILTRPKKWDEIPEIKLLPKINSPIQMVNKHYIYNYIPIKNFCIENKITIQSMLITMMARAVRKYFNLPNNTKIYNYTPCDSRASEYATEEHKNKLFFCVSGALFPCNIYYENIIEDFKESYKQLIISKNNLENISQILIGACAIDYNTLKYSDVGIPDSNKAITCASHIGKVNGNIPLFGLYCDCLPDNYFYAFHVIHTEEKIILNELKPMNFPKDCGDIFKNEMDYVFNLKFLEK